MIEKLLAKSFDYDGASFEKLFIKKLEESNMTRIQYEKLEQMERKSLNAILENTSKQTDILKLSLIPLVAK